MLSQDPSPPASSRTRSTHRAFGSALPPLGGPQPLSAWDTVDCVGSRVRDDLLLHLLHAMRIVHWRYDD